MPAGRPKIDRTEEDANEAQRVSKRLYARRIRNAARTRDSLTSSSSNSQPFAKTWPTHCMSLTRSQSVMPDPASNLFPNPVDLAGPSIIPWMGDLELLHHYTTRTCYTLADEAPSQQIWRESIPEIAILFPFLMNGILALSALHLAHIRPREARHFEIKAIAHQSAALPVFRELLKSISPTNCHALFAFSLVLIVLSFALPHLPGHKTVLDVRDQTSRWIRLVRGIYPMVNSMLVHIYEGSLHGLLIAGVRKDQVEGFPPDSYPQLKALFRLCDKCEDSEIKDACTTALEELRVCFMCTDLSMASANISNLATIMRWTGRLPPIYLDLLEQGNPIAMIILAHYTIVLNHLDDQWWVKGEPSRMLLSVYRLLDASMRSWLDWPLQVLKLEEETMKIG